MTEKEEDPLLAFPIQFPLDSAQSKQTYQQVLGLEKITYDLLFIHPGHVIRCGELCRGYVSLAVMLSQFNHI